MPPSDNLTRSLKAIADGAVPAALETERLDFKRAHPDDGQTWKLAVDAAICLANHRGGEVVIGVDDKVSGPAAFSGTTVTAEEVGRRIYELSRPPVPVDVFEHDAHGARLVIVTVFETNLLHADTKGRVSQRHGTDCLSLEPDQVARLRDEKLGRDWSSELCRWAQLGDVRESAIAIARTRLARYDDAREQLATASTRDLLAGLALIDGQDRLLNAAGVLLCGPPGRIGNAWIRFVSRDTPGSEPLLNRPVDGSMLEAIEEVQRLVEARRRTTPMLVAGGQQLEVEDFPELAVREALANAVLHRDYHPRGPVVVDHSPQVLVVTSPGPLVHGVSPQNILRHPPLPRNPTLAAAGHRLGLAEEVGAGVDRMYRAMLSTGKEVPSIQSEPHRVDVSLVGGAPDTQVARFVATLPSEEQQDVDTMIVLHYLRTNRLVRAEQLSELIQRADSVSQSVLQRLAAERVGLLEPTRDTARRRNPRYRLTDRALRQLGTAVGYQRRTVDEIDRKVIEIVSSYGSIKNEVVKTLFKVKVERASAILRDLVDRGLLVRTTEATRGPSVEYGPGPNFPRGRLAKKDGRS